MTRMGKWVLYRYLTGSIKCTGGGWGGIHLRWVLWCYGMGYEAKWV